MKVLLFLVLLAASAYAANWAVLVAGSNGFWNYRHQADVCHAYQTLLSKGFDANKIIVLSYDDVANSAQNPFKGQLFNKPSAKEGQDVYKGCKIDYRGADVTPATFMAVLKGDAAAVKGKGTGKVLGSTSADRVFINFSDHGATGLIAFPSSYLQAADLLKTFNYMHQNKMYGKLVFYLEACESGSMFQQLPTNMNIYALSASSPFESSWGYYCAPDDKVNGKSVGSCLGDLFSIAWMEDTDISDVSKKSLDEHFQIIKKRTTKSKVMQWGDVTFTKEPIGNYMGGLAKKSRFSKRLESAFKSAVVDGKHAIDTRDAKLFYLINHFKSNATNENLQAINAEFDSMKYFQNKFNTLANNLKLTGNYHQSHNQKCLKGVVEAFEEACGKISEYGLQFIKYLAEYCDSTNAVGAQIYAPIRQVCTAA